MVVETTWVRSTESETDLMARTLAQDFTQSTLAAAAVDGPELTFTGASGRMMHDSAGTLDYAPHNLALYSADASNAAWTKINGGTVSTPVVTPDLPLILKAT